MSTLVAVPTSAIRCSSLGGSSLRHGTQKRTEEFAQELMEWSLQQPSQFLAGKKKRLRSQLAGCIVEMAILC